MSWDQILGALGGGAKPGDLNAGNPNADLNNSAPPGAPAQGAETPGFGKQVGDTLLGNAPRTDSVAGFTSDVGKGLTNPHGLIGQAGRLLAVIAGFSHSPQMGLAVLNGLQSADAGERKDLAEASARGWTPQEYEARTGNQVPSNVGTSMQARDMPRTPSGPSEVPSQGQRVPVIQFPNTPEELTVARDAELRNTRSMPNFGEGFGRDQAIQQAELAQREGMKLGSSERTALAENAMNSVPSGQYKQSFQVSDQGMSGVFSTLPPEDRSMDLATYDQVKMPPGYQKIPIPDQENPGQMYMKIVNTKTGQDFWDVAARAGQGDPEAIQSLQIAKDFYSSKSAVKGPKLGSPEATLTNIQNKIQRELTPDEISEFKSVFGQGAKDLKPGTSDKKLQDFLVKVGYMADPAEQQANVERSQLYKEVFGTKEQQQQQPTGPATPTFPETMQTPGRPVMTPGSPAAEIPNAPPIVPKGLPMPKENVAAFKKKTFGELGPEDISFTANKVLETLTKSGDPNEAGKMLAQFMKGTDLNDQEKQMTLFSIVEELGIPNSVKLQVEKAAMKELD